jgi:hypothetical protein
VLRHVRQRLRRDVVGRRLDRRVEAVVRDVELDRQRQARRQRLERVREPPVGEDRRVEAARELAQLDQRLLQLLRGLIEERRGGGR